MRALPPEGSKPNRLITPVIDARGEIIGVQTVDLNPDGTKVKPKNGGKTIIEDRRYIDSFGKAALVKKGSDPTRLFIADGVETAASIAGILKGDYTVMASLGITQMVHAIPVVRAQVAPGAQIVLLADNDSDKQAVKNLENSVNCFREAGLNLVVVKPKTLKQDWNDVLQAKGNQQLKEEFCSLASIVT
ncbi:TPA: toprim domain-containing protein [Legionella pneumophila]